MSGIRIVNLATTATETASDDFIVIDGSTNGTRKILADNICTSVTVDDTMSSTSENPVQNAVIYSVLEDKADSADIPTVLSELTDDLGSSPVHTHSQYLTEHQDLSDYALSSDIPTAVSELTNDSGYITDAGVTSFNGDTGDITYTAPVTSVNGSTGDVTISIPTAVSELTNDAGYITSDSDTTYSLSISTDTITLTGSDSSTSSVTIAEATTSAAGLMSVTDKTNLDTVYADYSAALIAVGV